MITQITIATITKNKLYIKDILSIVFFAIPIVSFFLFVIFHAFSFIILYDKTEVPE